MAAAAAVCVCLTGCTGVPASSVPIAIESVGQGAPSNPQPVLPPDAGPRTVVQAFLDANSADPGTFTSARKYLTKAANRSWTPDRKTTVVSDQRIGTFTERGTLTVSGRVIGTLNAEGVYTPSLIGTGNGGESVTFTFGLDNRTAGQYRINSLSDGLILTQEQFALYEAQPLYFYDAANRYLVPDLRYYSSLAAPLQRANWLLGQLYNGPSQELQNVVNTDTLPARSRPVVTTMDTVTKISIDGSRQLAGAVRNRLAAQLSQSLSGVVRNPMSITDRGAAVTIPAVRGAVFSTADFVGQLGPPAPPLEVYYLDNGRIVTQTGKLLSGPGNNGTYFYQSVALARTGSARGLAIAAVIHTGGEDRLLVGTREAGMRMTKIHGVLSRPTWAPGLAEVWIGSGSQIYRVIAGSTAAPARVSIPSVAGGGRIVALRLSPDGSRLAMVVSGSNGSAQLYIGAIVRGVGAPQIVYVQTISPQGVGLTDVAWNYSLRLTAIGYLTGSRDARIFETGVDGSQWSERAINGLPSAPTSVTATTSAAAWVSADDFVWVQSGTGWVSPGAAGQTRGTNPVYLG